MEHFYSSNSGEDQKKKVFIETATLFFPKSNGDQGSDADHTQIIGGILSNYWGIYPPISPGFWPPWQ